MNQGKLEVVKQEMARVNVDILGISELKCLRTSLPFSATPSPRPIHAIIDLLNLHEKNQREKES